MAYLSRGQILTVFRRQTYSISLCITRGTSVKTAADTDGVPMGATLRGERQSPSLSRVLFQRQLTLQVTHPNTCIRIQTGTAGDPHAICV